MLQLEKQHIKEDIIEIIMVILMVWYFTDKGEHTVLYKINKNVYMKPKYKYDIVFLTHHTYTHVCKPTYYHLIIMFHYLCFVSIVFPGFLGGVGGGG